MDSQVSFERRGGFVKDGPGVQTSVVVEEMFLFG